MQEPYYMLRVQEVVSSNLTAPTIFPRDVNQEQVSLSVPSILTLPLSDGQMAHFE